MGAYGERTGSSSDPGRPSIASGTGDEHGQTNVAGRVVRSSPGHAQGRLDGSGGGPEALDVPNVAQDPGQAAGTFLIRPAGLSDQPGVGSANPRTHGMVGGSVSADPPIPGELRRPSGTEVLGTGGIATRLIRPAGLSNQPGVSSANPMTPGMIGGRFRPIQVSCAGRQGPKCSALAA